MNDSILQFGIVLSTDMKLTFENFAKAGKGTININDLTVICGPNNTGKTYINYAICSILENLADYFDIGLSDAKLQTVLDELKTNRSSVIDIPDPKKNMKHWIVEIENTITENIHSYYNLSRNNFREIGISLDFDELVYEQSLEYHVVRYGNKINGKYRSDGDSHQFVLLIERLSESSSFFELSEEYQKSNIKNLINKVLYLTFFKKINTPFPITSERTGISLFHKLFLKQKYEESNSAVKLDNSNGGSVKSSGETMDFEQKFDETVKEHSNNALPILKNIDYFRRFEENYNKESIFTSNTEKYRELFEILDTLLDGGEFTTENNMLMYNSSNELEPKIPLHAASSSIKALFLIDYFIKNIATSNHILIIDEPELNLFPVNQALFARLIANFINSGVKVLIATNSDFLIRELNNLIILSEVRDSNPDKRAVMDKYGYKESEIIGRNQVCAYMTTANREVTEMNVNKHGLGTELLDSIIGDENKKSDEVSLLIEDDQ